MILQYAKIEDVDAIIALIAQRIHWMDEMHLKQWNTTHYLEVYPKSYFLDLVKRKELFIYRKGKAILGMVALLAEDGRWEPDPAFFYVHHLTTDPNSGGL